MLQQHLLLMNELLEARFSKALINVIWRVSPFFYICSIFTSTAWKAHTLPIQSFFNKFSFLKEFWSYLSVMIAYKCLNAHLHDHFLYNRFTWERQRINRQLFSPDWNSSKLSATPLKILKWKLYRLFAIKDFLCYFVRVLL